MITWKEQQFRKQTHTKQRQKNTKHEQGASQLSPEKESRVTAVFQSGAFSPFPSRSNCLLSSLMALCLRFAGVAAVPAGVPTCSVGKEMPANVVVLQVLARVSTHSVGEAILPPWFEPTPVVMPSAVVHPVSHIPSFGEHCCPGVSRPVPADDDSSSPRSGSILPRGCGLSGKIVRLNKSSYGLKQASRSCHAHLTTCLKTLGFQ